MKKFDFKFLFFALLVCSSESVYSVKNSGTDHSVDTVERIEIDPNKSVLSLSSDERMWLLPKRVWNALKDGSFDGSAHLKVGLFDFVVESSNGDLYKIGQDAKGDPQAFKEGLLSYVENFKKPQDDLESGSESRELDHEVSVALAFVGEKPSLLKLKTAPQIINAREYLEKMALFQEEKKGAMGQGVKGHLVFCHRAINEYYKNNPHVNVQPCSCLVSSPKEVEKGEFKACVVSSDAWEKEDVVNFIPGRHAESDKDGVFEIINKNCTEWEKARYEYLKKSLLNTTELDMVISTHYWDSDTANKTGLSLLGENVKLVLDASANETEFRYPHDAKMKRQFRDIHPHSFCVSAVGVSSFFVSLPGYMRGHLIQVPLGWPFETSVGPMYGNSFTTPLLAANLSIIDQYARNNEGEGINPDHIRSALEYFHPKVLTISEKGIVFSTQREDGKEYPEQFTFSRKEVLTEISEKDLEEDRLLWNKSWLLLDVFRTNPQKDVENWDKDWTAEDEGGFFNSEAPYFTFVKDAHRKHNAIEFISKWSSAVHDFTIQGYVEKGFLLTEIPSNGELEPAHIKVTSLDSSCASSCHDLPVPLSSVYAMDVFSAMGAYKYLMEGGVKKYPISDESPDLKKRSQVPYNYKFSWKAGYHFEGTTFCTREEFIERNIWAFQQASNEEKIQLFQYIDVFFCSLLFKDCSNEKAREYSTTFTAMSARSILNVETLLDLALEKKELPVPGGGHAEDPQGVVSSELLKPVSPQKEKPSE